MKKYELIDHTADIGLRAYGKDLKQLFENAASGMFAILADLKNVRAEKTVPLKLEAPNLEELFLSWLSELLYQHNGKGMMFKEFSVDELGEEAIAAKAKGEKLNLKRHRLKTEIKAVTYHGLKVEKVKKKGQSRLRQLSGATNEAGYIWQAEVIFDV